MIKDKTKERRGESWIIKFTYSSTTSYWTNGLWSLDRNTRPVSQLYNAGQRGNVVVKGYFSTNIGFMYTVCTIDAWFYNDGGCDFNEYSNWMRCKMAESHCITGF